MKTYFDIETSALPLEHLQATMPEFTAGANLKDPAKIAADIERKRQEWIEDAALSPLTGRVLVIGVIYTDEFTCINPDKNGGEAGVIENFWTIADMALSASQEVIGFNIDGFDLPFLVRRSYALGVKIPRIIGGTNYRRWQWHENLIDLRTLWQLGDKQAHGSLDVISKFFGGAGKNGSGKDFAMHWETDRPAALKYLENDLNQTRLLAEKML